MTYTSWSKRTENPNWAVFPNRYSKTLGKVIGLATREQILDAFAGLRVSDVSDGMDWVMLHDMGLVDRAIRPVARGMKMCGVAKTFRLVPSDHKIPDMPPEQYTEYVRWYYQNVIGWDILSMLEPGDIVVIDASNVDAGLIGSNNSLDWVKLGARGVLTNGGCRDTDEIVLQKIPVFSRYISRTMVQGRLEYASCNHPVDVGGVLIRPGDIVVGDGDGVICVPAERALEVAKYARQEHEADRKRRRAQYEALNMPLDETVL